MECDFCGWDNPEGTVICGRCGIVLGKGFPNQNNGEYHGSGQSDASQGEDNTMVNGDGCCAKCGYPLLPNTKRCPNCLEPVQVKGDIEKRERGIVSDNAEKHKENAKETVRFVQKSDQQEKLKADYAPNSKNTVFAGAVLNDPKKTMIAEVVVKDPKKTMRAEPIVSDHDKNMTGEGVVTDPRKTVRSEPVAEPKKTLRVGNVSSNKIDNSEGSVKNKNSIGFNENPKVQQKNEELFCSVMPLADSPEEEGRLKGTEFYQERVVLKRENTEPDNSTITTQEQACLIFEDGTWYIEDKSPFKTTFVRAGRKMPLQDGDIIKLGDRRFVFKTKK